MLYWSLAFVLLIIIFVVILQFYLSAPVYKGPITDHFDGKFFKNYGGVKEQGFKDVLKWLLARKKVVLPDDFNEIIQAVPAEKIDSGIKITFINHSTLLIQLNNFNLITDPVFSERASPFQWIGPKRKTKPGMNLEDIPPVDLILLSHNHYDHLDLAALKYLKKKYNPKVITALGVGGYLRKKGIDNVVELDWWQNLITNPFTLHALPAQHFSGRGTLDRNRTLWCGFLIESSEGKIYFAGDTGFGVHLEMIKTKFPSIDIGLLPIGAYKPVWFMSPVHISLQKTVKIHSMLNITQSIATHYGTFTLADEGWNEPIEDLQKAILAEGTHPSNFRVFKEW